MGLRSETRPAGGRDPEEPVCRKRAPETRLGTLQVVETGVCENKTELLSYVGPGT